MKIKKVLIANRGEIAVRLIRAARELGIETVAVFSDADRDAIHTRMADEAYYIGHSSPEESYLNIDKIINVAKTAGVQAIHPGYGFLSENPQFARKTVEKGIIFIGPPGDAMEKMGDKTYARRTAKEIGVPITPGMEEGTTDFKVFKDKAEEIDFPILIKAAMGGGGKGMRIVRDKGDLESAFNLASQEAKGAFGDATLFVEKYIEEPRHIEIQVVADNYGNVIHLGERECSIQRRHQKIIEESPSVIVDEALRNRMGEDACKITKASGYQNAGTVEFLVDKDMNYYFMEMNTRLQVEHPVTELVTGIDIVKEQFFIADGEPLRLKQEDIYQRGSAIEVRIYAEDPDRNFIPAPGLVKYLREPSGPGIRLDNGVYEGFEIPVNYDPLISKLIVWAETRELAVKKMIRALKEYKIVGIKTTTDYLREIMEDEKFQKGEINTHFLEHFKRNSAMEIPDEIVAIAALSDRLTERSKKVEGGGIKQSLWKVIGRKRALR